MALSHMLGLLYLTLFLLIPNAASTGRMRARFPYLQNREQNGTLPGTSTSQITAGTGFTVSTVPSSTSVATTFMSQTSSGSSTSSSSSLELRASTNSSSTDSPSQTCCSSDTSHGRSQTSSTSGSARGTKNSTSSSSDYVTGNPTHSSPMGPTSPATWSSAYSGTRAQDTSQSASNAPSTSAVPSGHSFGRLTNAGSPVSGKNSSSQEMHNGGIDFEDANFQNPEQSLATLHESSRIVSSRPQTNLSREDAASRNGNGTKTDGTESNAISQVKNMTSGAASHSQAGADARVGILNDTAAPLLHVSSDGVLRNHSTAGNITHNRVTTDELRRPIGASHGLFSNTKPLNSNETQSPFFTAVSDSVAPHLSNSSNHTLHSNLYKSGVNVTALESDAMERIFDKSKNCSGVLTRTEGVITPVVASTVTEFEYVTLGANFSGQAIETPYLIRPAPPCRTIDLQYKVPPKLHPGQASPSTSTLIVTKKQPVAVGGAGDAVQHQIFAQGAAKAPDAPGQADARPSSPDAQAMNAATTPAGAAAKQPGKNLIPAATPAPKANSQKATDSSAGTGSGSGSGSDAGSGSGSDAGSGSGSHAGSGSGSHAGSGSDISSTPGPDQQKASNSGANSGTGSDASSGLGAGSGTGSDTGSGSGAGTGTGSGPGAGTGSTPGSDEQKSSNSASGSVEGSESGSASGSGAGTNSGSGSGSGADTHQGSNSGASAGASTSSDSNSDGSKDTNLGGGSGNGLSTSSGPTLGSGTISGSGSDAQKGSSSGSKSGTGSDTASGTGTGSASGEVTGSGSGSDTQEGSDSEHLSGAGAAANSGSGSGKEVGSGTDSGSDSGSGSSAGSTSGSSLNSGSRLGSGSGAVVGTGGDAGLGKVSGSNQGSNPSQHISGQQFANQFFNSPIQEQSSGSASSQSEHPAGTGQGSKPAEGEVDSKQGSEQQTSGNTPQDEKGAGRGTGQSSQQGTSGSSTGKQSQSQQFSSQFFGKTPDEQTSHQGSGSSQASPSHSDDTGQVEGSGSGSGSISGSGSGQSGIIQEDSNTSSPGQQNSGNSNVNTQSASDDQEDYSPGGGGSTVYENDDGQIVKPGDQGSSPDQSQQQSSPSRSTTVDGVPVLVNPQNLVIGSQTYSHDSPSQVVVAGHSFSWDSQKLQAGSTSIPIPPPQAEANNPMESTSVGNIPVVASPDKVMIGANRFDRDGEPSAAVVDGHTFSWDSNRLVADKTSIQLPTLQAKAPVIAAGSQSFTINPSNIEVAGSTIARPQGSKPSPFTVNGKEYTISPSEIISPDRYIPLPFANGPKSFMYDGHTLSVDNSQLYAGASKLPLGPSGIVEYEGRRLIVGPSEIVGPSTTIPLAVSPSYAVVKEDGVTFSIAPSDVVIGGLHVQNLPAGMAPITTVVNGQTVNVGANGVAFASTTIPLPTAKPSLSIASEGGLTFSLNPSEAVIEGETYSIAPSSPSTTTVIDGQTIGIGPSGIHVVGTTVSIPTITDMPSQKAAVAHGVSFSVGVSGAIIGGSRFDIGDGAKPGTLVIGSETVKVGSEGVIFPAETLGMGVVLPATTIAPAQTPSPVKAGRVSLLADATEAVINGTSYPIGPGARATTVRFGNETIRLGTGGIMLPSTTVKPWLTRTTTRFPAADSTLVNLATDTQSSSPQAPSTTNSSPQAPSTTNSGDQSNDATSLPTSMTICLEAMQLGAFILAIILL